MNIGSVTKKWKESEKYTTILITLDLDLEMMRVNHLQNNVILHVGKE